MAELDIYNHYNLKALNTFAISAHANNFAKVKSIAELQSLLQSPQHQAQDIFTLGSGSNILLTQDFPGLMIHNAITGLALIKENAKHIWLNIGAGMNWHQLVLYCIERNYAGIENLSLIPGTVGATPIQNIGAYGVELKDVFVSLQALNIKTNKIEIFNLADCEFSYRNSIFKNQAKGQYIILDVTLKLNKQPVFNIHYGSLKKTLDSMAIRELSIKAISDAVINIRQSKLPDPNKIPNAGSFFRNPYLELTSFENLQKNYPDIPSFPISETIMKIPAAWLIEQCGWKGKRAGKVGVHTQQAVVLANYDNASGYEVWQLAQKIQQDVLAKFNIELIPEVTVI